MKNLPVAFVICRRNDIAENFHGFLHRTNPSRSSLRGLGRNDFRDRLSESSHANGFLRQAHLLEENSDIATSFMIPLGQ